MNLDMIIVYILLSVVEVTLIGIVFLFSKMYKNNKKIPKMEKDIILLQNQIKNIQ